jgi:hypothetical protein
LEFELQRLSARVAIAQVDRQQERLREPPKPGQQQSTLSPTTARDLVDSLGRLLDAQNSFLGVWVDNEVQRLSLDLDLGTMQLNAAGMWIDPGPIRGPSEKQNQPEVPEIIPAPEAVPEMPVFLELQEAPPAEGETEELELPDLPN